MSYFTCSVCHKKHPVVKGKVQCCSKRANTFPVQTKKHPEDFPWWLLPKAKKADPHIAYLPVKGEVVPHFWTGTDWIILPEESDMVLHECKDCHKWHPKPTRTSPVWCKTHDRKPIIQNQGTVPPTARKSLMDYANQ